MIEQIAVTAPKLRALTVSEYVKALVPRELPESIDRQDNADQAAHRHNLRPTRNWKIERCPDYR